MHVSFSQRRLSFCFSDPSFEFNVHVLQDPQGAARQYWQWPHALGVNLTSTKETTGRGATKDASREISCRLTSDVLSLLPPPLYKALSFLFPCPVVEGGRGEEEDDDDDEEQEEQQLSSLGIRVSIFEIFNKSLKLIFS
jgi:hypothetical protein